MKSDDLIQWGLLALIAYLAYQKFAKNSFELDPNFGVKDPNAGWDDVS